MLAEAAISTPNRRCPLAGMLVAVKDNIDVAGLPTTAACPAFTYGPDRRCARGRAAACAPGALVLGKTNLDQFATGLVGTRSPYGAVRDPAAGAMSAAGRAAGRRWRSPSGIVDLALGTDTAGSGRVPAAFQGLVGDQADARARAAAGVVPACRTLDCVTVFARDVASAERALWTMAGSAAPRCAPRPARARLAAGRAAGRARRGRGSAVPAAGQLGGASAPMPGGRSPLPSRRLGGLGRCSCVEMDIDPFLAAGDLLYGGAYVAERHAALGAFVDAHPDAIDPTVRDDHPRRRAPDGERAGQGRRDARRAAGGDGSGSRGHRRAAAPDGLAPAHDRRGRR